jgi:hypothetical protein
LTGVEAMEVILRSEVHMCTGAGRGWPPAFSMV